MIKEAATVGVGMFSVGFSSFVLFSALMYLGAGIITVLDPVSLVVWVSVLLFGSLAVYKGNHGYLRRKTSPVKLII